ncbi:hypothetical protein [Microvirga sp. VF16]|uniref:hypothetical protein n=1 Tax=Microvirga sp. VF16 TaxID=2807101 RepID=UPI00193DC058|nr:hypothetical protein [Microvirga sp. VF16]QRM29763.1 hypothetical protein JO965_01680 [Microvirga sp. VF16]QRM29765.1 hypothetical protein JO965_01690 [Microvirga sp. VF16]
MDNFQLSVNDIFQNATNTADHGNATSAQVASIADADALLDSGGGYWGGWFNDQESFNTIDQNATNTAFGGSATSAQVATISDGDTLVDMGHDYYPVF